MIFWGSKGKQKVLSEGLFFCPRCGTKRQYKLTRVSKYFTLYFIPLFETKNLGEFVICQTCENSYDPKILEPSHQAMLELVSATKYELLHGTPIQDVKAKLIEVTGSENIANNIIAMAQKS